jgi:hypothetical protein
MVVTHGMPSSSAASPATTATESATTRSGRSPRQLAINSGAQRRQERQVLPHCSS